MELTETLAVIVKCLAALLAGVLAGNGAVWFFNKMPARWLCDYGRQPGPELTDSDTQRVKSYPWKFLFTMLFVIINIKLVMDDWRFSAAAFCSLWLLLEMSIADVKYRIVPDQLLILLAVSALGYIPYHGSWQSCLFGGLAGFSIMFVTALAGRLAYRRETMGGGDIKLFACLGLITGLTGILVIFAMTALISAGHLVLLLALKKKKKEDTIPMVPYAAVSAAIYLIFLWGFEQVLYL